MNQVELTVEEEPPPKWVTNAQLFLTALLDHMEIDNRELSLFICRNKTIQTLNRTYRKKDEATDVLSFSQNEGSDLQESHHLGDIVISYEYLKSNAEQFHVEPEEELKRLLIHGTLHLTGMTHQGSDPGQAMLTLQEKLVKQFEDFSIGLD